MTTNIYLKNNFVFKVDWDMNNTTTYTYGAKIGSDVDTFSYSNPMMAQAVKIHTWYSQTSYTHQRFSPTLPLLKSGHNYTINSAYHAFPDKSIFTQIDFFNSYGQKIDNFITDSQQINFNFPDEATSYQINLVNASSQKLVFKSLLIFESTSDVTSYYFDVDRQLILSSNDTNKVVNISFNNCLNHLITMPRDLDINSTKVIVDPYLNFKMLDDILMNNKKELFDKIINYCKMLDSQMLNKKIIFSGYCLFDSVLAILISQLFPSSKVNVCLNFEKLLRLEKELSSSSIEMLLNMISEMHSNEKMG